jgi:DNA relaxase NicK
MSVNVMHSRTPTEYGEIEEVRAGIDWLSCTLSIDSQGGQGWAAACVDIIGSVADEGHAVGSFGLNGYKGILTGGCFYGKRDDGWYLQLSGAHAQEHYRRITRADLGVSRLDLAVTVKFRTMPNQLGQDAYTNAAKSAQSLPGTRSRKIWYMSGSDNGYTLYIGSPKSEQRGRLYNKEVQSDEPSFLRTWRYEVVLRNALADQQFASLCAVHEIYTPLLVSAVVREWYNARGVICPWSNEQSDGILPVVRKAPSDAAKKLLWLQKQVKPAVKWLIEAGYEGEVYTALGLDT